MDLERLQPPSGRTWQERAPWDGGGPEVGRSPDGWKGRSRDGMMARNEREGGERGVPPPRYIPVQDILVEMADFGDRRLNLLSPSRSFVLAVLAGGFITVGALFSVLLAEGVEPAGLERLLEGIGFSAGFFFVVLSETVLFLSLIHI